ncbi:MAG: EF-P lysine aminoacylase GenX [Bdellovibrio sp. CG10_big_fil_rev_8_21_14_0_10_47_8]|nr:MAG: EF-P lysine aminoacylase GenX [Bdellovibrio sp. CG10_big_fil_rev_8_21_14_0_10_47_8]
MTREHFLEKIWTRYPAMPEGEDWISGRLSSLSAQTLSIEGLGEWTVHAQVLLGPSYQGELALGFKDLCLCLKHNDWLTFRLVQGAVQEIFLLAPALTEPPRTRVAQCHQQKWMQFLSRVREFFVSKGFQEVQTPTLVTCPGTEPFLDLFSTEFKVGSRQQKFYLPTSPELHLKKILALGQRQIFEMRPCFRNGEISERHQPEFWMLEWYRAFSNLEQILQDTLHLLEFVGAEFETWDRKSMAQLFQEHLDFSLTPTTSMGELIALAQKLGLQVEKYELWDDVFYLLFVEKIEPFLNSKNPLIVDRYPPSQAALARLTPDGWGDRFELYWKGFEIANAFHELNDPQIQKQRFEKDLQQKRDLKKEIPPLDTEFIHMLESGMPPSGGIALGLERLFMALHGIERIEEVKMFPISL